MSLGPTARCFFCGGVYYVEKLASHESVCSMRPKRLAVMEAVEMARESRPEASADLALLVRLVWQIRDAYRTEPPFARLTDPRLIFRASLRRKEKRRPVITPRGPLPHATGPNRTTRRNPQHRRGAGNQQP